MFALTPDDLGGGILDCAAGPASFNAELTQKGGNVVSCDPLYRYAAAEIRHRVEETSGTLIANARAAENRFAWHEIESPDHLRKIRLAAMNRFLADFPAGLAQGRYLADSLPRLSFGDDAFDLALCSHFLFLYPDHLSESLHVAAVREMCRVAREARIFPLLGAYGTPSPHVEPVVRILRALGYAVEIRRVPYEFLRGGDKMLMVTGPGS